LKNLFKSFLSQFQKPPFFFTVLLRGFLSNSAFCPLRIFCFCGIQTKTKSLPKTSSVVLPSFSISNFSNSTGDIFSRSVCRPFTNLYKKKFSFVVSSFRSKYASLLVFGAEKLNLLRNKSKVLSVHSFAFVGRYSVRSKNSVSSSKILLLYPPFGFFVKVRINFSTIILFSSVFLSPSSCIILPMVCRTSLSNGSGSIATKELCHDLPV